MLWESLTAQQFPAAIIQSKETCIIPMGCMEKHGEHLPIGTDMIVARNVARLAAEIEPAVVFPDYYFTQIHEAKHQPGAVAISGKLLMELLENVCDEIARNGFKKIVFFNYHGGNESFLHFYLQLMLEKQKPYVCYWLRGYCSPEFHAIWDKLKESKEDGHAGESETSIIQQLNPELVNMEALPENPGYSLNRLSHLPNISTPINWYAAYPDHYAGFGQTASDEKGKLSVDDLVRYLADNIKLIKKDRKTFELYNDFFERVHKPSPPVK